MVSKHRLLSLAAPALLLSASLGSAQNGPGNYSNFNRGVSQGGHGGHYQRPGGSYNHGSYHGDNGYRGQPQGGIGPGKGALIGGAGGAVLGAVFGDGLKGSLIGGAAGAGIGAIAGKVHQDNRNNSYYRR